MVLREVCQAVDGLRGLFHRLGISIMCGMVFYLWWRAPVDLMGQVGQLGVAVLMLLPVGGVLLVAYYFVVRPVVGAWWRWLTVGRFECKG